MKASLQPKPMYCSRDYYFSSRFNQQYEKPTPIQILICQHINIPVEATLFGNIIEQLLLDTIMAKHFL